MDTLTVLVSGVGGLLVFVIIIVFLVMLLKSYVKAPPNRAFVRTGGLFRKTAAPPKVVMNGGAWVFGFIHEMSWVDLRTMAIEIERTEQNALLTKDPQYADIKAIFYIKVHPAMEGIIDAARTIGGKVIDAEAVKRLVDAKLDGALRDVAATFTLMSLHQERENFIKEVQSRVKGDLEENGLVLESVSILTLKAARQGSFGTDDVFGAQVARANAEVIQMAQRKRNDIERQTEIEIKQRDITTAKEALSLEQDLAFATATQEREVRTREAAEKAAADQDVYQQEQAAEQARITKERAVRLSEIEMEEAILVKGERKQQEIEVAEIQRDQAKNVAEQANQVAVIIEQQKREEAEKERLLVMAQQEKAAQEVKTVEEVAQAERTAQRVMIDRKNEVEIAALKKIRDAQADAEALQEIAQAELDAAEKQAETKRTEAHAERDAEKARAEADKARASALGLAEAEVMRAKAEAVRLEGQSEADVIQAKAKAMETEAEVIRAKGLAEAESIEAKGLAEAKGERAKAEALAAHDNVQQELELQRLQIDAQIQIGVARANAVGEALASMEIKMFGTPDAANNILRLMSYAEGMGDVIDAAPPQLRSLGNQVLQKVSGNGQHNGSPDMTLGQVAGLLPQVMALVSRTLDMKEIKSKPISEVVTLLEQQATEDDRPLVSQIQTVLTLLPFLADMSLEDLMARYSSTADSSSK